MAQSGSVRRYRRIDLALLMLIAVVFETVAVRAAVKWFPGEPYAVSIVPVMSAIALMRWGAWGGPVVAVGALVTCFASSAAAAQYAVYVPGSMLCLVSLVYLERRGKENVRGSALASMLFALMVTLLMQLGRALMALIFGASFNDLTLFFMPEVVTLLFTLAVVWIVRRLDGVFEDQIHYLGRVRAEQERAGK